MIIKSSATYSKVGNKRLDPHRKIADFAEKGRLFHKGCLFKIYLKSKHNLGTSHVQFTPNNYIKTLQEIK